MLTFKNMHLTVYKRDNGEPMVAMHARDPLVGDEGIRYLSFYFTHAEFIGLVDGTLSGCNDIGHNIRKCGECWTFFDMEFSREVRGVMHVPFVNVNMPHYVALLLKRAVRLTLRKCQNGGERIDVQLPLAVRERWMRRYGRGTGKVEVEISDRDFYDKCAAEGGETFKRCVDNLTAIGKNQTLRASEVARVVLSKDWDGFYFRIVSPRGTCVLNGGVINHGRDGAASWSTHT